MTCATDSNGGSFCDVASSGPDLLHTALIIVVIVFVWYLLSLWFSPIYNVWKAHKEGEADLARAKNEQQIQVAEAQGRLTAAEANKRAAIVEAEAVSEQIKIIGDNVKAHPLYLTWQWIEMMKHQEGATIYVPTEANLPVMEGGRWLQGLAEKAKPHG